MNYTFKIGGAMKNRMALLLIICFIFSSNLVLAQGKEGAEAQKPDSPGKITLDIKGMDVVDVFKMLAVRSGMNIVVGKNVTGKVTLFLKNVDIWDAFQIVLSSNDLAYDKKGDVINVMTQRDYELLYGERYQDKKEAEVIPLKFAKAADLSRALTQIKTNIGKVIADEASNTVTLIDTPEKIKEMKDFIKEADLATETRIFALNYAQADKIQPKIQEAITKGVGSIKIDERTNKIAVTDYPGKLDDIARIIEAFDEKPPQVLIDAQIIEIKPSDKFEMGVDWDYWIRNHFRVSSNLPIGNAGRLLIGTTQTTPTERGDYKAVVDILRTIGDAKILSSPRIMTLNNQEARILVGTKDAYITSTTSLGGTGATVTSQSVNFVDVGIKLYVTPTINRSGFVTMKIRPEISSATRTDITADGKVTQIPIVTTSEAETMVMVKDGVTIIIGGLQKDEKNKTTKKIPILGDIPFLGIFFKSVSDEVKKTELVILLTPHIMSGESSFTEFSEARPAEGAIVNMVDGEIITRKISLSKEEEALLSSGYYQLILRKIKESSASNTPQDKKGRVYLSFKMSSDGNLINEPQVMSATDTALIPYALKAVKEASPFPLFPRDLRKEAETFNVSIDYK